MNDVTERNFREGEILEAEVRKYNLHREDNEVWREFNLNERNIVKFIDILKSLKHFPTMEIMDNGEPIDTEEYKVYKCIEVGVNRHKLPVRLKDILNIKEILKAKNIDRVNSLSIPRRYNKVNIKRNFPHKWTGEKMIKHENRKYITDNFAKTDNEYCDKIYDKYINNEEIAKECFIEYDGDIFINISHNIIKQARRSEIDFDNRCDCRNFYNKFQLGKSLYIHGVGNGVGKTHLAFYILKELSKKIPINEVKHEYTPTLIDRYNNVSFSEKEVIMDKLTKCSVLFLDDFGKERNGDIPDNFIFSLLEARINEHLITIFTSNKKIGELNRSSSIMSRIGGSCDILEVDGNDLRLNIKRGEQ